MSGMNHKLYQYEVPPPPGAWEKIMTDLDSADLEYNYPSRLHSFEAVPPVQVWQAIEKKIGEEVTPQHKVWYISVLRYAAAAAVITFITWGAIKLLNKTNKQDESVAIQDIIPQTGDSSAPGSQEQIEPTTENNITDNAIDNSSSQLDVVVADARNEAALEASKKTFASLNMPVKSKVRNASNFYFVAEPEPMGVTRSLDIEDYSKEGNLDSENIADRYFMLLTPDGNIVRMSKKLGDMVCCVSGEEQDDACLEQLKKWRKKVADPSTGHSPGNFMDILSLLSNLQESDNL
ncbi:MAG TPA: hypothetical protein P5158_05520 [Chitinophagaceae bacterium]|nr:hypothetical protein [Chitinophagaceae bacterium]MCB9056881.1 hypothetical protein [Chitinophagales bacterium]HRX93553.1 hypothetical protein [Chitinophagaceae bacterium]